MLFRSDAQGVLQDVHWSTGAFGYFPSYTLGNLYSAQIFAQARKEIADLDGKIERGELKVLRDWLKHKIFSVGRRKRAEELIRDLTGNSLSEKAFIEYLQEKYVSIRTR